MKFVTLFAVFSGIFANTALAHSTLYSCEGENSDGDMYGTKIFVGVEKVANSPRSLHVLHLLSDVFDAASVAQSPEETDEFEVPFSGQVDGEMRKLVVERTLLSGQQSGRIGFEYGDEWYLCSRVSE